MKSNGERNVPDLDKQTLMMNSRCHSLQLTENGCSLFSKVEQIIAGCGYYQVHTLAG